MERLISLPALQFKGTGWYVTDYGRNGKIPSASNGKTETKSDSGSESKGESKAEAKAEAKSESKSETKTENKPAAPTSPTK